MRHSHLIEERKLWKKGYKRVACLDEAGRGPLAGPVVAAAVVLFKKTKSQNLPLVKDSKKLSPQKREKLYKILTNHPHIKWKTATVSEKVIDKINIKNASELAMFRALQKLKPRPDYAVIDGKFLKNSKLKKMRHKLIVKADEKVFSCMVASIIAKVARDRIMEKYHKKYPFYGFNRHKGYPTRYHLRMLKRYKSCPIHRQTFGPVKAGLDFLKR